MTDPQVNSQNEVAAASLGSPQQSIATPSVSLLMVPDDDSKHRSLRRTPSDRVRRLFRLLAFYDSLYLCPLKGELPRNVMSKVAGTPRTQYEIKDYYGVTRYYAVEINSWCNYFFCSNNRSFEVYMYAPNGDLVFESCRPCGKTLWMLGVDCCCCCTGGIETEANFRHEENYIGSVVSSGSCRTPTFMVQNAEWGEKFYIRGPTCSYFFPFRLCYIDHFSICSPKTKVSLGKIMRGYDGLTEDLIPDPNTVGVIFPPKCTPEIKACLLTLGFMLDVSYFQHRGCTLHRIIRQCLNWAIIFVIIGGCLYIIWQLVIKRMIDN